jgi:trehalose 6-phosphate phosphatase
MMQLSIAENNAVFLDIDGTLLDIAPKPDAVVVPGGLNENLSRLRERLGGALALISGRPLDQIDHFFPQKFAAAAEHGAIMRDAEGRLQNLTARPTAYDDWYEALKRETKDLPGVMVEVKTVSLVIHYRLAPQCQQHLKAFAENLIAKSGPDVTLLPAHMAYELRPKGFGKGDALAAFMKMPPFAGRQPIFIGDDTTDEPAIALANEMGGAGLHVARDFGSSPEAVRVWLGQ